MLRMATEISGVPFDVGQKFTRAVQRDDAKDC
jgi:hypothetical protein